MAAFGTKLRQMEGGALAFWCPGCNSAHMIRTGAGSGPRWSFNGNGNAPTFAPSVLLKTGHHVSGHTGECWCTWEDEDGKPSGFECTICHSFVRDGQIQFLNDCTHKLAGQTVPLPDFPA
ncbi:MAG: DUF6527 family protein [Pikeienuella sp.]